MTRGRFRVIPTHSHIILIYVKSGFTLDTLFRSNSLEKACMSTLIFKCLNFTEFVKNISRYKKIKQWLFRISEKEGRCYLQLV